MKSLNLDDQNYDEIMREAIARIPWLCPEWTDHNASDPGITMLEEMAWYKEMEQYRLNTVTERTRLSLLSLIGVEAEREHPASCGVRLVNGYYPELSRFTSEQGIYFELDREVQAGLNHIEAVYARHDGVTVDITTALESAVMVVAPFRYDGGASSELLIGFDRLDAGGSLTLTFKVADDYPVKRNPFGDSTYRPRRIHWSVGGAGELIPRCDGTHDLSESGDVVFDLPAEIAKWNAGGTLRESYYLLARQEGGECSEDVRLTDLRCDVYPLTERRTLASRRIVKLEKSEGKAAVLLRDELSRTGFAELFIPKAGGYIQADVAARRMRSEGVTIELKSVPDAEEVLAVSLDPIAARSMIFDSDGLPGMALRLDTRGGIVLRDSLSLLCDTVLPDGNVGICEWQFTDNLKSASPSDRVFTCEDDSLVFGDGEHGAIVPRGKNAVMVCGASVSLCAGGNIPEGTGLWLDGGDQEDDGGRKDTGARGGRFENTAGRGGRNAEDSYAAARRVAARLSETVKCASETDYERLARETPGLRIKEARAIPCYDPDDLSHSRKSRVMTVAVIPYSSKARAAADGELLGEVRRRLDRYRTICTVLKVVAARYAGCDVSVTLKGTALSDDSILKTASERIKGYFDGLKIGGTAVSGELAAAIDLPGIAVTEVKLQPSDHLSESPFPGTVKPLPDAVLFASSVKIDAG